MLETYMTKISLFFSNPGSPFNALHNWLIVNGAFSCTYKPRTRIMDFGEYILINIDLISLFSLIMIIIIMTIIIKIILD